VEALGLEPHSYVLMTMHRPANVDTEEGLRSILKIIEDTSVYKQVLFPIHPRTRTNIERFGLSSQLESIQNLTLMEPQGYLEFLNLMENAAIIVTDSGGIQEETTYLQVPCLTFRNSTERPVTVDLGTNQLLADLNPETVHQKVVEILQGKAKQGVIPPLWDGQAAGRIAEIIAEKYK
jgi:UDP-N-acetylglucosamine 2-epimerase (non-hydrolysing)